MSQHMVVALAELLLGGLNEEADVMDLLAFRWSGSVQAADVVGSSWASLCVC